MADEKIEALDIFGSGCRITGVTGKDLKCGVKFRHGWSPATGEWLEKVTYAADGTEIVEVLRSKRPRC